MDKDEIRQEKDGIRRIKLRCAENRQDRDEILQDKAGLR